MITGILDALLKILGPITALSKDRRELKDSALRAISNALSETQLYYRDLGNGSKINKEREALISKAWAAAAIPMRHIDSSLSDICAHKADYWINPDSYSEAQIIAFGMELNKVNNAYREILAGG